MFGKLGNTAGRENSRSGRSLGATKRVIAICTVVIVEYMRIDGFAKRDASGAAGRAADQRADDGTGQTAKRGANRASQHADSRASFGTGQCHGGTTGCARDGARSAADLRGAVKSFSSG